MKIKEFEGICNFFEKPLDIERGIPYNSRPQTKRGIERG
jgi:hypothetical protein